MLDLMIRPVFCVKNGIVCTVNEDAARILIREGTPVETLLETGSEEYSRFSDGCLCVRIVVFGQSWDAFITRSGETDYFTLEEAYASPELQALALAARELRAPLSDAMISAQYRADVPGAKAEAEKLNRKLYQLLRLVGNMSDASGAGPLHRKELLNIAAFYDEVMEKAAAAAEAAGYLLTWQGLSGPLTLAADPQQLERAALNLISNAMKFTPKGGKISAQLTKSGNLVQLRVTDGGEGIPEEILGTVFQRYLRQPSLEESRQGIGLGLLLVRSAAAFHGGTVLIDKPEDSGTRVTMTLSCTPETDSVVKGGLKVDYAGELDHLLVELSDVLPPTFYEKI